MTNQQKTSKIALVTGATGLLGSHIAHKLRDNGVLVRALCREGSDTRFLRSIGAQIVMGDLTNVESLRRACANVDQVYHSGAKVGDWGPWNDFVRVTIDGTRLLLEAAAEANVGRFLHISSISVYGHIADGVVVDERAPLGVKLPRGSYYSRAKIEAEKLVWATHERDGLPVTVIRPSWIYGPRDRASLPRLVDSIRKGKLKLIGDGTNRLNLVYVGNVAEAAILAAESERAVGETYNCSHDGVITLQQYFNMVAEGVGHGPITARVPVAVAKVAAFVLETIGRLTRSKRPPLVTRYSVWLLGRRSFCECNKIKEQLGWEPTVGYEEGVPATVRDFLAQESADSELSAAASCSSARDATSTEPAGARS